MLAPLEMRDDQLELFDALDLLDAAALSKQVECERAAAVLGRSGLVLGARLARSSGRVFEDLAQGVGAEDASGEAVELVDGSGLDALACGGRDVSELEGERG